MITFRKLGRFGRFGNQLFQYAGTRLYAELNGFKYSLPDWPGNIFFRDMPSQDFVEGLEVKFLPTIQLSDVRSTSWSERLLSPIGFWSRSSMGELYKNPKDNINLYGYLQDDFSLELLNKHKDQVKKWFTFKEEIDNPYEQLTRNLKPYIGMHIRRGDLVKRDMTIPVQDYIKVLNEIRNGRDLFIATDDRSLLSELAHLNPISPSNPMPEIPAYVFDFWMLKNAETIIGGGSTFSWWASFLGSGDYYSPPLSHLWDERGKEFKRWRL